MTPKTAWRLFALGTLGLVLGLRFGSELLMELGSFVLVGLAFYAAYKIMAHHMDEHERDDEARRRK